MRFVGPQNRRTLIAIFIILAVLAESLAYVVTTPRPAEQFFQFYVLSSNRTVADYFPKNNSNLLLGSAITWYLGVTNFMGKTQLVEVRVKLGNETTIPPNDTSIAPSPAAASMFFDRFISQNETWNLPFIWSIRNATAIGGYTYILALQINNVTYPVAHWSAANGLNFRLIFELWVWQTDANTFAYGWNGNGERHAAWLQLWFNLTSLDPLPQGDF